MTLSVSFPLSLFAQAGAGNVLLVWWVFSAKWNIEEKGGGYYKTNIYIYIYIYICMYVCMYVWNNIINKWIKNVNHTTLYRQMYTISK